MEVALQGGRVVFVKTRGGLRKIIWVKSKVGSAAASGRLLLRPLNHAGGSGLRQTPKPSLLLPGGADGSPLPKYLRNTGRGRQLMGVATEALKHKRTRRIQTQAGPHSGRRT